MVSASVRQRHRVKPLRDAPALTQIKQKLPAHVFHRDASRSTYYLLRDLFFIAATFVATRYALYTAPVWLAACIVPPLLALQGTFLWALFVVGHDAGHGSFARSRAVCLCAGIVAHSILLVPFLPWKLSHRHHHKNTGHIDNDEVFNPKRQKDHVEFYDGIYALASKFLGVFWFLYMMVGSESNIQYGKFYLPGYYEPRYRLEFAFSMLGMATMAFALFQYYQMAGALEVLLLYFVPLLGMGSWLVVTTFLHHNDEENGIPWYSGEKWSYVKGNLSSVDRSFGWLLDEITHNIATHQVHHLFPAIPHYHLKEATVSFRKQFPQFVRQSDEAIFQAFAKQTESYVRRRVVPDNVDEVVL